jgi:hypothetical protein
MGSTRQAGKGHRSHRGNVVVKFTPDGTGGSHGERISIGSAPVALPDAGPAPMQHRHGQKLPGAHRVARATLMGTGRPWKTRSISTGTQNLSRDGDVLDALRELLRTGKVAMMPVMIDEEIGEIQDALKAYKEQLNALREDIKIVAKYTEQLRHSIISVSLQSGNQGFDQAEVKRCQEFRDKYQIHIG